MVCINMALRRRLWINAVHKVMNLWEPKYEQNFLDSSTTEDF
jgi:hypothetical protein